MNKFAITKEAFGELVQKGMLTVHCSACGTDMGVEMPMMAAMTEESVKAITAAEKAAADARQSAEKTVADALAAQQVAEKAAADEKARADSLTRKLATIELLPLVGVKLSATERDELVELSVLDPDRYKRMLDGANGRQAGTDLTARAGIGGETNPQTGSVVAPGDATGSTLATIIANKSAQQPPTMSWGAKVDGFANYQRGADAAPGSAAASLLNATASAPAGQ
ncbi:MAG: hypothetical protein LUO93_01675 [Methanomicrobiales archaeon]|nr:hypothetical protein [Methanomicrobiales archaeon]